MSSSLARRLGGRFVAEKIASLTQQEWDDAIDAVAIVDREFLSSDFDTAAVVFVFSRWLLGSST